MDKKLILKTLVGSQAHGLATKDSDWDFRGVYVVPTSQLLDLSPDPKTTHSIEGKEDNTSYELKHFLQLTTRSNPSVLEVLVGPIVEETVEGKELRGLFDAVWSSDGVYNAFSGYSHNQQKKFLEDKDGKTWKYAVAYIRMLILGEELLRTRKMNVKVSPANGAILTTIKRGEWSKGSVLDLAEQKKRRLKIAYDANPDKQTDFSKVNEFLLKVRKENF